MNVSSWLEDINLLLDETHLSTDDTTIPMTVYFYGTMVIFGIISNCIILYITCVDQDNWERKEISRGWPKPTLTLLRFLLDQNQIASQFAESLTAHFP